jgi:hypothetical protein
MDESIRICASKLLWHRRFPRETQNVSERQARLYLAGPPPCS